jgi:hypothetical protein
MQPGSSKMLPLYLLTVTASLSPTMMRTMMVIMLPMQMTMMKMMKPSIPLMMLMMTSSMMMLTLQEWPVDDGNGELQVSGTAGACTPSNFGYTTLD